MKIEPIKSEKDHRRALMQIEVLLGAAQNTPEGERLDMLATIVCAWEEKHHPIDSPEGSEGTEV